MKSASLLGLLLCCLIHQTGVNTRIMKKLLIIPLVVLLAGCGKEKVLQSAHGTVNDSNSDPITVTEPMTISNNDLYSVTHKNDKLNLQLFKGWPS
jgi:hypothetical protein